ncbi:putative Thylakoid lumenal 17.4 kDa protein, chloroplast precursor [Corchorus olitorius]|uniref:Thylakoid lumenal 17.4 kDa protein, chloroplast n=1 Tax=Corchorus olitorius TaxID=93759 RepID=A0A1R3KMD0_9ROSI|nr:putative Thylakoid lumenal 17.4 kDa protein, chloroplast precursor [Corchorus olitorius]
MEAASKCAFKIGGSSTPFKELKSLACGLLAICAATASPVIPANQVIFSMRDGSLRCEYVSEQIDEPSRSELEESDNDGYMNSTRQID